MEPRPRGAVGEICPTACDYIKRKLEAMDLAFRNQKYRERIINLFNKKTTESPKHADAVIVLGTSFLKFPDKFKKRVYLATRLALQGQSNLVIFTGLKDHEAPDVDQAADAMKLAVESYNLPRQICTAVGGNNTQQNFAAVQAFIASRPELSSAFVVSDSKHLLRAIHVAHYELGIHGIRLYPKPTDYFQPLEPNNPLVIMEIIKLLAYHRSLYHTPYKFNEIDRQLIKIEIDLAVAQYREKVLHDSNQFQLTTELPFGEWLLEISK